MFTAVIADAPAFSAAIATSPMFFVFGESLTKTGSFECLTTAFVISKVFSGVSWPANVPKPGVCGQDSGISIAENSRSFKPSTTFTKSSVSLPITLAKTGDFNPFRLTNSFRAPATPKLEYPTAFIIPPSNAMTVGFL